MSFKWPSKDKDELLDYSVDWSRFLAGNTITSIVWSIDNESGVKTEFPVLSTIDGLQNVSQTISGAVATINLNLGTDNAEYKIYCTMTDNTGSVAERVVRLKIKEQ